eukprot:scaffold6275_cov229-Prasinococcus_capsulatus_cf.AAC.2
MQAQNACKTLALHASWSPATCPRWPGLRCPGPLAARAAQAGAGVGRVEPRAAGGAWSASDGGERFDSRTT